MTPKERDQLYQQATTRISVGGGTMMRGPIDGDLVLKAVEDSRKLADAMKFVPHPKGMSGYGDPDAPDEVKEMIALAAKLHGLDQPGGEA